MKEKINHILRQRKKKITTDLAKEKTNLTTHTLLKFMISHQNVPIDFRYYFTSKYMSFFTEINDFS